MLARTLFHRARRHSSLLRVSLLAALSPRPCTLSATATATAPATGIRPSSALTRPGCASPATVPVPSTRIVTCSADASIRIWAPEGVRYNRKPSIAQRSHAAHLGQHSPCPCVPLPPLCPLAVLVPPCRPCAPLPSLCPLAAPPPWRRSWCSDALVVHLGRRDPSRVHQCLATGKACRCGRLIACPF